jgi:hypothetical protein
MMQRVDGHLGKSALIEIKSQSAIIQKGTMSIRMTAETPRGRTADKFSAPGRLSSAQSGSPRSTKIRKRRSRHFADDFTNEILSGLQQFIEGFYTQDKSVSRDDKVWWTTEPPPMQSLASD